MTLDEAKAAASAAEDVLAFTLDRLDAARQRRAEIMAKLTAAISVGDSATAQRLAVEDSAALAAVQSEECALEDRQRARDDAASALAEAARDDWSARAADLIAQRDEAARELQATISAAVTEWYAFHAARILPIDDQIVTAEKLARDPRFPDHVGGGSRRPFDTLDFWATQAVANACRALRAGVTP